MEIEIQVAKESVKIFLDVETTGIKSYSSHIIEVAAVVADAGLHEIDNFHTQANPGEEAIAQASPEALEVNRISLAEIRQAPPSAEAARLLKGFLDRYPQAQYHAFNNDFDLWFLARTPWSLPARAWGECVMRAAQEIMAEANALKKFSDGQVKWPSLQEASQFFGIPMLQTHRALDDTRMAHMVYREILAHRTEVSVEDEAKMLQEDGL